MQRWSKIVTPIHSAAAMPKTQAFMIAAYAAAMLLLVLLFSGRPAFAQAAAPAAPAPPPPKVLLFGHLVDANGKLQSDVAVVVENGRIKSMGDKSAAPSNVEVVDLSRYTAIPGLIDVHTHLPGPASNPSFNPRGTVTLRPARPAAVDMFLAQPAAKAMLEHGVTSVRNLGAIEFADIAMRDLINMGAIVGPRMFVSGPGLRSSSGVGLQIPEVTVDSVAEARRAVRYLVENGVDCIKIFASTGGGVDVSGIPTFRPEELAAAIAAAHALKHKVAVHSYGPIAAHDAVFAGTDTLEHAVDIDDATIAEMKRGGIIYVPTIDHNRFYMEHTARTDQDKANLQDYINRNVETARRVHKAGVRIATGSDGGGTLMIGETTRELGYLVKAGMTAGEALTAATVNGAAVLGKENELGKLAPGYIADIVAVDGNPLADVNVTINKVRWVMKGGAVMIDRTKETAAR